MESTNSKQQRHVEEDLFKMESTNSKQPSHVESNRNLKHSTLKTKKANITKTKFKSKESKEMQIENSINTLHIYQHLFEDALRPKDFKNQINETKKIVKIRPDAFEAIEKDVATCMGIVNETRFENNSGNQEFSNLKRRRSVLADRDTNVDYATPNSSLENVYMSEMSGYLTDSSDSTSYRKKSTLDRVSLNKSDHELSHVFSKLSLSSEKPKWMACNTKKHTESELDLTMDKKKFLHDYQGDVKSKPYKTYSHSACNRVPNTSLEMDSPTQEQISEMFDDISFIPTETPNDTTVQINEDSQFMCLDNTVVANTAKTGMVSESWRDNSMNNTIAPKNHATRTNKLVKTQQGNKEDNAIHMHGVLASPEKSVLEESALNSIYYDLSHGNSSEEEYFSGMENTVVTSCEDRQSIYFVQELRTRSKVWKQFDANSSNGENNKKIDETNRTKLIETKNPPHSEVSDYAGNPSVQFCDNQVRESLEHNNTVGNFSRLLKNITVRRGTRKMVDVPEILQTSKVSLVPGKMWKRSLIDKSIRERESHKFSRSLINYDESMSTVLFKSHRRNSSISQGEDTLSETLTPNDPESLDDNEYCRERILHICEQDEILSFEDRYPDRILKCCRKIGEGVYGEVFKLSDSVIKIMPIERNVAVNGEEQKRFREIFSEIMVTKATSDLQYGMDNSTPCFTELLRCSCVQGRYPSRLIHLWEEFAQSKKSYNDHPSMFKEDQIFIILELKNGGVDSVDVKYRSPHQTYALILQVIFSLAVAEIELEFEHRDLHMSNILIRETAEDEGAPFILNDIHYELKNAGVRTTIIDFTLSRCYVGEKVCFCDLSQDEELFEGEGDYQFDMYRMMRSECQNNWQNFTPRNNVMWIHYLVKKATCPKSGYCYMRTPRHQAFDLLEELEQNTLRYDSCYEMVQDMCNCHSEGFKKLKQAKLIRSTKRR